MAVVTVKSTPITNRDAVPRVFNHAGVDGGSVKAAVGVAAVPAAANSASTYRLVRVPSNAVVHSLKIWCGALTNTGAFDIGIYQTTDNGGAVVDADHFASAVNCASAVAGTDVVHESGVFAVGEAEQPLWQALGLTEDPKRDYDIVATQTETSESAANMAVKVIYAL